MIDDPFDPWHAVAECDDLVVSFHPVARLMGGGFYARVGRLGIIVIDPELDGTQRRTVLTHELIHHERGGRLGDGAGSPQLRSFVDGEERSVDREVANRLVPGPELDRFVRAAARAGAGVSPPDVAAHFEVPVIVATRALEELARGRARHHRR